MITLFWIGAVIAPLVFIYCLLCAIGAEELSLKSCLEDRPEDCERHSRNFKIWLRWCLAWAVVSIGCILTVIIK